MLNGKNNNIYRKTQIRSEIDLLDCNYYASFDNIKMSKPDLKPSGIIGFLNNRKAKHREYVGNRVWELHEEICSIALNVDKVENKFYQRTINLMKQKLWYLRKYQRYYRIIIR